MADQPERQKRRYVSPKRDAALAATHQRIVQAAADLFGEDGYRSTTLAAIARRAGVSVPRVNLSGSKPALLVEAYERMATGSEVQQPVTEEPELVEIMRLAPEEALPASVEWLERRHELSVGLWFALIDAAATDEEAAEALAGVRARNAEACTVAVAWARAAGMLSGELSDERRAESWDLVASAEPYRFYVQQRGWSGEEYRAWVLRALRAMVLDPRD